MPLQVTAAPSSHVTKSKAKSILQRRSSSSPFATLQKRKPVQRSKSKAEGIEEEDEASIPRLDNIGLIVSLKDDFNPRDVIKMINYVYENMFDEIPERSGMNSTRIAEVLNFRRTLPPLVTNIHLHALSKSTTTTEKAIASLLAQRVVRKITIPGRGTGASSISEGLVLAEKWIYLIKESRLELSIIGLFNPLKGRSYNEAHCN